MFKRLLFAIFISTFVIINAQEPRDLLSIPGPIELDGTEFFLSWSKEASKTLLRQQYMPRDEQIEDFNQILDFSYFTKEIDLELAVRQKVESIQKRAETDRLAKVNVTESPDRSEFVVDYFISEMPDKGDAFVEYNIYRFKPYNNGTAKNFLILAYAKRIYGDTKSAAKALAKQRDQLMLSLIEYKIPEIVVLRTGNN